MSMRLIHETIVGAMTTDIEEKTVQNTEESDGDKCGDDGHDDGSSDEDDILEKETNNNPSLTLIIHSSFITNSPSPIRICSERGNRRTTLSSNHALLKH